MEEDDYFYQTEINLGFFGMEKQIFYETIFKINQSSFSETFSIKDINTYKKRYSTVTFQKKNENKKNENDFDNDNYNDINYIINNLKININLCDANVDENDEDHQYVNFIKSKLDYFFFFNIDKIEKKQKRILTSYSKGNYIYFSKDNNNSTSTFNLRYDNFLVNQNDCCTPTSSGQRNFVLEFFLQDIENKFNSFLIIQKYSEEKNMTFKDYFSKYNEYFSINDDEKFKKLFNKFEKFSFNNDYPDDTLILLQIMSQKGLLKNNDLCLVPRSIKCGFCTEELNISKFDKETSTFLCYRCRLNKKRFVYGNSKK